MRPVCAIVLAAGHSSRMGSAKALLDYQGKPFLATILDRLAEAGIADRTVVLGKHADAIRARLDLGGVRVAVNPDPDRGQLSSFQEGLRALAAGRDTLPPVLVCLVDHPSVGADTYRRLAARLAAEPDAIVLTRLKGKHGHPVAIGSAHLKRALELEASQQMREVLKGDPSAIRDLDVDDDGVRWDVDTPQDYVRLVGGTLPEVSPSPARAEPDQAGWTDGKLVDRLGGALHAGHATALVTVIDTVGSAPRPVGAKMLVHADGRIDGTIGGGTLEALAIREALLALDARRPKKVRFNLGATGPRSIGMFCGGEVEVFIDVLAQPVRVLLIGAGHVGERIARVSTVLGLRHAVADDRDEYASRARFPDAECVVASPLPDGVAELPIDASTFVVIATRCHTIDMECLARVLETKAPYIGMIGSVTKVRQVFKLLAERGIDAASDPRVHAPVGLALGASDPGAIALSVLSEIMMAHHGGSGRSLREGAPVTREEAPAGEAVPAPAACAAPSPNKEAKA